MTGSVHMRTRDDDPHPCELEYYNCLGLILIMKTNVVGQAMVSFIVYLTCLEIIVYIVNSYT